MSLQIKEGVDLFAINPVMLLALTILEQVYAEHGVDVCVVTSCRDGEHSPGSYHRFGLALDIRTNNVRRGQESEERRSVLAAISNMFASRIHGFDLILEHFGKANEHSHLEYDPR